MNKQHLPISTSREPPGSELESQCERSNHIPLQYMQGVIIVERRQFDFTYAMYLPTFALCPPIIRCRSIYLGINKYLSNCVRLDVDILLWIT